ncbi:hypothetical protein [Pseudoxanthomonas sp. Root630]|uniref:hypothetical protein n=1 Tax=Pseudoxanthomonas sp. Root630 TaxID=1736574 RepID=UPI000703B09D|nr:hypothetical protein [Pseudoxanthomonas sp. Root630]KRA50817.1 hypothetical protein ASD72_17380 [Pseudoxanthomonas sp. Root630]
MRRQGWTQVVRFAPVIGAMALMGCRGLPGKLETARAEAASTLPAPYLDGLVTESVAVDGTHLVFVVRTPEGDAGSLQAHPKFAALRESEQREMPALCAQSALQPLAGTDAVFVRRFVDRHDVLIFELTLPAHECPAPPA